MVVEACVEIRILNCRARNRDVRSSDSVAESTERRSLVVNSYSVTWGFAKEITTSSKSSSLTPEARKEYATKARGTVNNISSVDRVAISWDHSEKSLRSILHWMLLPSEITVLQLCMWTSLLLFNRSSWTLASLQIFSPKEIIWGDSSDADWEFCSGSTPHVAGAHPYSKRQISPPPGMCVAESFYKVLVQMEIWCEHTSVKNTARNHIC